MSQRYMLSDTPSILNIWHLGLLAVRLSFIENDFNQMISGVSCKPFFLFQVLPDDMIVLAEPAPEDMVRAVRKAIDMLPGINPQVMHLQVKFNSQISTHCTGAF